MTAIDARDPFVEVDTGRARAVYSKRRMEWEALIDFMDAHTRGKESWTLDAMLPDFERALGELVAGTPVLAGMKWEWAGRHRVVLYFDTPAGREEITEVAFDPNHVPR